MKHFEGEGFTEIYPKIIQHIYDFGTDLNPRGMAIREIENLSFTLRDPLQCTSLQVARKFNFAYAVIEMLSLFMHGSKVVGPLLAYNPNMSHYLNEETGLFDGSYADRLTSYQQLRYLYKVLKDDPDSRRAVLSFYNPAHDQHESADICCTLNIVFRIRNKKLNATCFMRSNDILWGIYDYTMFTFLQNVLATWLGVGIGDYTHVVSSFHFYLDKNEEILNILKSPDILRENHPLALMPRWDLKNIEATFEEIGNFFKLEKLYRNSNFAQAEMLANSLKSNTIKYLWAQIVRPFIIKKLYRSERA